MGIGNGGGVACLVFGCPVSKTENWIRTGPYRTGDELDHSLGLCHFGQEAVSGFARTREVEEPMKDRFKTGSNWSFIHPFTRPRPQMYSKEKKKKFEAM